MKNKVNLIQLHVHGRLFFVFLFVECFSFFFLSVSFENFVLPLYFIMSLFLKGLSNQKQDNSEPLKEKKKNPDKCIQSINDTWVSLAKMCFSNPWLGL